MPAFDPAKLAADVEAFCQEIRPHEELCYVEHRPNEQVVPLAKKHDLLGISIVHRGGRCEIGETTVAIACSAPHRGQALDACRDVIEALKRSVPIWKREVYRDGAAWIGQGS